MDIINNKAVDRYNVSRIVENDIREKAMTEGMEKGIEKGMEKGIEKVARKLKAGGASIELIIQATGLSAEKIAKL